MQKVSRELPSLVNGVSQQHPQLRMRSQGDDMLNMTPSLVHGLRSRLPIEHVKKIVKSFPSSTKLKTHLVPRGSDNPQFLLFYNNDLKRFSDAGNWLSTAIYGNAYITTNDPENDLVTKTVADTTFVVNKRVNVVLSSSAAPARPNTAMVFVKVANYQTNYILKIAHRSSMYTTPHGVGTETNPPQAISTEQIANGLATGSQYLGVFPGWPTGFTVVSYGSIILITAPNEAALKQISVSDSRGDTQMYLISSTVNSYSELPNKAPNGFITKVLGGPSLDDEYFVRFVADDASQTISPGYWVETAAPGLRHSFNAETMPHRLSIFSNSSAWLEVSPWASREAGDDYTNPPPSFLYGRISDIFFYRNRLGVLSGDNVILSRAGEFFNFWHATARTITDGDPIDYSASQEQVHGLLHAVPFQEQLLLFSEKTQFALTSGEVLAPATAVVKHIASHQIRGNLRPVAGSKTLFFCSDEAEGAEGTRLKEFYVDMEDNVREASDITAHVPKYIPVDVKKVVSNTGKDTLFILPENGRELYVYKYFWSGKEKIQSAWFKYTLPSGCVCKSIETYENTLYLFNVYDEALYLEKMSLEFDTPFEEIQYPFSLDRQFTELQAGFHYDAVKDETVFSALPYPVDPYSLRIVERQTGLEIPVLQYESSSSALRVQGDHRHKPLVFGYPYNSFYQFSDQYMLTSPEEGYAVTTGRLQYRNWKITYGLSGSFSVDVYHAPQKNTEPTENPPVTSAVVGTTKNGIGQAVLKEGQVRIGVYANAREVKIRVATRDHLPMSIVSAAWEAVYATRTGRVV